MTLYLSPVERARDHSWKGASGLQFQSNLGHFDLSSRWKGGMDDWIHYFRRHVNEHMFAAKRPYVTSWYTANPRHALNASQIITWAVNVVFRQMEQ